MSFPSTKFKKMLCAHDQNDRRRILDALKNWLILQFPHDPGAVACHGSFTEAHAVNSWASNKEFKDHYLWAIMQNHDNCVSFQEIIKAKLSVPKTNIGVAIASAAAGAAAPRKAIPKKIRGEAWKAQFGTSTEGSCYCCRKGLDIFDDWHAGHIVSHASGGTDTAANLRPVCASCNLSMGTEHMDAFKARCYPPI
jgi:5-methylcytosine-specific restriction endonuclease McrA